MSDTRGIALVLVLFVMMILLIVTMTLSSMAMTDNQISLSHFYAKKAFNLARSGVIRARAELKTNASWGQSTVTHIYPNVGSYAVTVELKTNSGNGNSYWLVTSVGQVGEYKRTIYSWLEPEPFSKYMYMTNSEIGQNGDTIWFVDGDSLDGPVHTNGYFSVYKHPDFSGKVTSANNGDSRYNSTNKTYSQGGSTYTDPSKFFRYYTNYTQDYPVAKNDSPDYSFTGGVSQADFPFNLNQLKAKATYTYNGNVNYIKFLSTGQAEINTTGSTKVYVSTSNATLYINGNVNSMYGTIKGQVTVASSGDVKLSNNIVYSNTETDLLGVVAQSDIIVNTSSNVSSDIVFHASFMAVEGSFYVQNYDSGVDRGTISIFGSLTQKNRGAVGTFGGRSNTGYSKKDYVYDKRLAFMKPPNYPTTGKIVVKAFLRDKGSLGGN
ncbi:MAG: DUF4900 domain-containing protein [Firmicutes bacterium]|nr:DUF4900 domain-containing protein [Bacillota bacterium]